MPPLVESRNGRMFTHPHDNCIGRSIREYGEWAQQEIVLLSSIIKPEWVVFDIGANIGTHAIAFAKMVGPSGLVIAFEPQMKIAQYLSANAVANDMENIVVNTCAVGSCGDWVLADNLDFKSDGNHGGAKIYQGAYQNDHSKFHVKMITIDSMNVPACHFIKADIEGFETDMIVGADTTIRKYRPVMYLEWHDSETLVPLVKSYHYDVFKHETTAFNPDNFFGKKEDFFNGYVERNILCVPKEMKFETNLQRV